jgi:signal peptidase II
VREVQAASGTTLNTTGKRLNARLIAALAGVAVFVLAADIITKALVVAHLRPGEPVQVIGSLLEWNLLRNPGAAFSVGNGNTIVFTVIAVVVIGFIVRSARKLRSTAWAITLGLLLGGACGNLVDRIFRAPGLFRGEVVDFIEVTRYWPVFNLADSAIVCGGILTVLLALLGVHMDGTRGDRTPDDDDPAADDVPAADVAAPPDEAAPVSPESPASPAPSASSADADR